MWYISIYFPSVALGSSWLSGWILDWRLNKPCFDHSFGNLACLATLKSCDTTKQSLCGWQYICSLCMQWVYCHYFKLLIYRMHLFSIRFYLLSSKLESVGHCLRGKHHREAILSSRNFETAYCTVLQSCWKPGTNISQYLGVNLMTMERIRNYLDEFWGDYEDTAARKPHSDRSDEKKTQQFVAEIHDMVDNDSSMWIRSIARDMLVSNFIIEK